MGIDPVFKGRKVCNFDCVYCQIGRVGLLTDERRVFVDVQEVIQELGALPPLQIDYSTFSGAGEPTLAANLGDMIKAVKKVRKEKIAVITNSSLLSDAGVRKDLSLADCVVAKLDAPNQDIFNIVNRYTGSRSFDEIVFGLKKFKGICKGKFALQMMFIKQNKDAAKEMARIAREIGPHEIQLNTPLRPSRIEPLSESDLDQIERYFEGMKGVSVYKAGKKTATAVSDAETLKRRGKI